MRARDLPLIALVVAAILAATALLEREQQLNDQPQPTLTSVTT